MPIRVPDGLPASEILSKENIFVMPHFKAERQDIRPLRIALLNIMPTKIVTETQITRLLSNTALQVDLCLLQTSTYQSKNISHEHLSEFYKSYEQVKHEKFDGLIITGAPVENMRFEEVDYWGELCSIMEWAKTNVYSTLYICWGAQAGLYYHYGVNKYPLEKKMFGIFPHEVTNISHELVRGFDEIFYAPHSRHTEIRREDIEKINELEILAYSEEAGIHIVGSKYSRHSAGAAQIFSPTRFFITGHSEYDCDTLALEYFRDKNKGLEIELPKNYFPNDDDSKMPKNTWRSHAHLLFSNWLNYFVYQSTSYDFIDEI